MKKGKRITRYNSRFSPVRENQVGEVREFVDRNRRVGFLGRIIKVTKNKVTYRIEA